MTNAKFRLRLLGAFALFTADGVRVAVPSKRSAALLALLAMTPDGERSRVWLQSMLWGSRGTEQAQASLRRELSNLIKAIEACSETILITRTGSYVTLHLDRIDVDALAVTPRTGPGATLQPSFLEGFDLAACDEFEDWLRAQRDRIEEIHATRIQSPISSLASAVGILGGPLPPRDDLLREMPPPLTPKPSIAILPFATDETDGDRPSRGAMLAEAAGMSLARYPHIFVVSSLSAAALLQRGHTQCEIAEALGVHYLLDGSLSKGAISVRLVDGRTGVQRWSRSFALTGDDLLSLQEEIAIAVAPQIWTRIDQAERHRGLSRPLRIDNSYDLYWRANALIHQWTADSIREALDLTRDLVVREPDSGWAAAICAFCNAAAFGSGWAGSGEAARRTALIEYQNALRLEPDNVEVMGYCAGALTLIGGDRLVADHLIDSALSLFPAYQPSLFWGGWVDLANDRPERASERFELSLRINPVSGVRSYAISGIGLSRLMMGDVEQAYSLLFQAHIHIPQHAVTMAGLYMAALAKGEESVARTVGERLRRSGNLSQVVALFPNPAHRALLIQGLAED